MLGILSLSLSRKEICVVMRVWGTLGKANHSPTWSKVVSPQNQEKYNEYTPEERAKMGRYGAENGSYKVAKPLSLLLAGKLPCSLRHSGCYFLVKWPYYQI